MHGIFLAHYNTTKKHIIQRLEQMEISENVHIHFSQKPVDVPSSSWLTC